MNNRSFEFNLGVAFGRSVSVMDAPEHPRYRRIFQKAFLPNVVAKWGETLVDPVVEALISDFRELGQADLVQQFTLHYPFRIIYRQLGLPPGDATTFHRLAIGQMAILHDVPHGTEASRKLGVYFKDMLAYRRGRSDEDLVGLLLRAEVDGEALPEEILISFLRQLINAGGDTTYRATSVLLTALLSNPDQLEAVKKERSLVPQAIEEAVRWDGPSTIQSRITTRDVVLGGVSIPRGSVIDVCGGAANRYPKYFPDPDRFDICRPCARHVAFGGGPHICIGQHLARVEMTRALNALLDRLPNLRLDPNMPPPRISGAMMRVPKHLYVRFEH